MRTGRLGTPSSRYAPLERKITIARIRPSLPFSNGEGQCSYAFAYSPRAFRLTAAISLFLITHSALIVAATAAAGDTTSPEVTHEGTMGIKDAINHLLGSNPAMQQGAIIALAIAGKPAAPLLLDQLEAAKDGETRGRIGWALEEIFNRQENRDPGFLSRLEKIASSDKYSLASPALGCIAKFKGVPQALAVAGRIAKGNPQPAIRGLALGAYIVVAERRKSEIAFIKQFLDDPSIQVQIDASRILGSLGDKSGLLLIMKILRLRESDRSTVVLQRQAAIAAGEIGDKQFIPELTAICGHPSRSLARPSAYESIAAIEYKNLGTETSQIDFLVKKLEDSSLSYWAALNLKMLATPAAEAALLKVAGTPGHTGRSEAHRFHQALLQEKSSGAQ